MGQTMAYPIPVETYQILIALSQTTKTIFPTNKINQLPAELLVQILFLSQNQTYKDRYPHLRLSSVCRYWRRVINGYGAFWTVIHFSPWKGEEFIRELVTRSRSAKLSVFSPLDSDISISKGSRLERARIRDILITFNSLLQTEGHRIKFLFLTEDRHRKLPKAVLGKPLPVLKTFIFKGEEPKSPLPHALDPFTILKSAENLENLNITLQLSPTALLERKPSFERLTNLKINFTSGAIKRQFFISVLPLCYKLESLTVLKSQYAYLNQLPSAITLPNLLSLDVDCFTLVHTLRAPALKRLIVSQTERPEFDQHDYLIFDEFDVSSITQLSVSAFNIFQRQRPMVTLQGSTGGLPCTLDPWAPYELVHNWGRDIDLRRDITLTSDPTQFSIWVPTDYTLRSDSEPEPGDSGHPFIQRILPKLHNLETLSISPFLDRASSCSTSDLVMLRTYLKEILNNVILSKLRSFAIGEAGMNARILQVIFEVINGYPSLSNLDKFIFAIYLGSNRYTDEALHAFGKELVNSLRLRQQAGYKALAEIEVHWGRLLPKECISEAAALGTRVFEYPFHPRVPVPSPSMATGENEERR